MGKFWKVFIICILWCVIAFGVGMIVGKTISDEAYEQEIEKVKKEKPLILRVYDSEDIDKIQVLTVYAGDEILYQCSGDMEKELSEDGTEIKFIFPAINDSCFDEGGSLLE